MPQLSQEKQREDEPEEPTLIEIVFFKSDSCAFCPRAEEILHETLKEFDTAMFKLLVVNVAEQPEAAEEYGVFALPTIMIGGVSVTGIPEPEAIMRMILGYRAAKREVKRCEQLSD